MQTEMIFFLALLHFIIFKLCIKSHKLDFSTIERSTSDLKKIYFNISEISFFVCYFKTPLENAFANAFSRYNACLFKDVLDLKTGFSLKGK